VQFYSEIDRSARRNFRIPSVRWRADAQRRHLAFRLALLADLEKDDDGTDTDLRIAALEALERKDEAQSVRWRHFERFLSAAHLRAYLKRQPDFEDSEAEQKALGVAIAHQQAARGLAFFIEWRVLGHADRLVRERLTGLDGRLYEVLRPAAEALEEKFPEAASLFYRRLIESVLQRGSSKQYQYATRDLLSFARLAPHLPVPGSIESHASFVAPLLQKAHGRKYGFRGGDRTKGTLRR
jgi:hypothetical protein